MNPSSKANLVISHSIQYRWKMLLIPKSKNGFQGIVMQEIKSWQLKSWKQDGWNKFRKVKFVNYWVFLLQCTYSNDWESVENDASLLLDCPWEKFLNKSTENFIILNYEFFQFSQMSSVTFSIFYNQIEAAGKASLERIHKLKTKGYQDEE